MTSFLGPVVWRWCQSSYLNASQERCLRFVVLMNAFVSSYSSNVGIVWPSVKLPRLAASFEEAVGGAGKGFVHSLQSGGE